MNTDDPVAILIVDNNPLNVKLIQTSLFKEGYILFTAYNGPDARKIDSEKNRT